VNGRNIGTVQQVLFRVPVILGIGLRGDAGKSLSVRGSQRELLSVVPSLGDNAFGGKKEDGGTAALASIVHVPRKRRPLLKSLLDQKEVLW
jgi:hypothetical protein